MTKPLSIYLDLVRITAAVLVFMGHVSTSELGDFQFSVFSRLAHDAVVVFFVLSGFVIAYVVDSRERNLGNYLVNRLARLWSVAVPALLLSWVATLILAPGDLQFAIREMASSLFFVNQVWLLNETPRFNLPFWSLGFEAFYYLIFGFMALTTGWVRRLGVTITCLVAGPKILLLFPIWLLGALVYRVRVSANPLAGLALFLTSGILYVIYRLSMVSSTLDLVAMGVAPAGLLGMAKFGLSDFLVGGLVAMNFVAFRMCEGYFGAVLIRCEKIIRAAASCTLSLYLYHLPLAFLMVALLGRRHILIIPAVIAIVIVLSRVTEARKGDMRQWIMHLVSLAVSPERLANSFPIRQHS